jgi:membrane protein
VRARWQSFKAIVRLWVELFDRDNLLTYASAIALQALIAAIASALLGVGILGATGDTGLWNKTIGPAIARRVLPHVYGGLNEVVQRVFSDSSTGLLVFAAAFTIWEVSGVVRAVIGALNSVYETTEERPWWIRFPVSFGVSAVFTGALLGAIVLVVGAHAHGGWEWPVAVLRWVGAVGLIMLAFGLLVRWAPTKHRARKWASAGAILVVTAWIVETLIFRWYVTSVADFRTPIGSFASFIVLTSYLYVGAIILLVGMELDELVRLDAHRPRNKQQLLPHVVGVIRGS